MRTRQLRLNPSGEIKKKLPTLIGKQISAVLSDNTVLPGLVTRADERSVDIKNSRLKTRTVNLEFISELYFDTTEC